MRVAESALVIEGDFEFPRVIVWDALLDPDLVSGWLGGASITPEVGGRYDLRWLHRPGRPESHGRVTLLEPLEHLQVDTADAGRLQFDLLELAGGSRGTSSRLRVTVAASGDVVLDARAKADWLTNLDQLEDLLRGHPVDWANWERDRQASWSRHLGDAQNSTA